MSVYVIPDVWTDINTLTGIPVGTQFTLQNVGSDSLYMALSETTPIVDKGLVLYDVRREELSICTIPALSGRLWLKARAGNATEVVVDTVLSIGDSSTIPSDLYNLWPKGTRRLKVENITLGQRYVIDGIGFALNWVESAIPTGTSRFATFNVPAGFYLAVDSRLLNPSGDNFVYRVYPQGTYTLGTPKTDDGSNFIRLRNYRQNATFNPTSAVRYNVTTPPSNTQFLVYGVSYGTVNAGNRSEGDLESNDAFLLLNPNQQFLLEMRNNGTVNPLSAQVYINLALIPEQLIPPAMF